MRLRWGPRRRSPRLLALGAAGPDLISPLPDDLLLLILARLECAAAAVRTGVLSRRWRGLWPRLRRIVLSDVALPSLEAALGCFPPPPPAVSLIKIRIPKPRGCIPTADTARVSSLLRAAARLDPEELCFVLASGLVSGTLVLDLPNFHRATSIVLDLRSTIRICVPAGVEFPALETLSLSHCTADPDALLSRCPRLRKLRLADVWFRGVLIVNSLSLQKLVVNMADTAIIEHVNIVAPVLTQLKIALADYHEGAISILAPMVEKVWWRCYLFGPSTMFGVWRLRQLTLRRQGQRSSLRMHAYSSTSFQGGVVNFAQQVEKHMIIAFSVLELRLRTTGHVYGSFVVNLLGLDRIRCDMQRLKVSLERFSTLPEECPPHCPCDPPNWKSQTISLTSLEEVEINGFEGEDHEFDLLKLILRCAPMLKRIIMKLSQEASASSDKCRKLYNIFREYSTVECYVYLSSGLMHGSQNCPST